MKRYLFTFVLLAGIHLEGKSQTSDTLCLPVSAIQKILIAATQKKVLEEQVVILNSRITNYEKIIDYLNQKDSITVAGYGKEIKLMTEQRALFEKQITDLNKYIKKERFRKTMTAIGWGTATAIMTYLYITK